MGFGAAAAATGGVCVGFRWIPKEEKFYSDFLALADELKRGARLLEEMLAPDRPDLGQGRRDQGSRAQVRLPDARNHSAPQPDLRDADRPRRHPRAGAVARRRDGRDRRLGDAGPPLSPRKRPLRRARTRADRDRLHRRSAPGTRRPGEDQGRRHPRRSRSTGSRTRPTGCISRRSAACSTTSTIRSSS